MRKYFLMSFSFAAMVILTAPQCLFAGEIIAGPAVYEGREYYVIKNGRNMWQEVEDYAVELGGHLVALNDADEEDFIQQFLYDTMAPSLGGFWIGLYRPSEVEPWLWAGGDPTIYLKGIGGPGGNCVQLIALDATWQRWPCTSDFIGDGRLGVIEINSIPKYSCSGFEPPMANYPVTVKKNRALPLKARVFDTDGCEVLGVDFISPPVLQVLFDPGTGGDPVNVTDDVLSVGEGTDGNQFIFTDDGYWQFNLKTKNYTATGTYILQMESGDDSEYVFEPTCGTEFAIK